MTHRPLTLSRTIVGCLLIAASACQPSAKAPHDSSSTVQRQWHDVLTGAPGALLSMWTSSEGTIWAVGAAGDSDGPMVLVREKGDWVRLLTGLRTHLWWVHGFADGAHVIMAGDDGSVLDYAENDPQMTHSAIDNAANIYGLWGATVDDVWFVGRDTDGNGLIARRRFGLYETITPPATVAAGEAFFKVWGTATNHLIIVGERGTILRWDGTTLTHDDALAGRRLVTIHGRDGGDMVVVGGVQRPAIFHGDAVGNWTDRSPSIGALLNGVFVAPDGYAAAAGFLGFVLERVEGNWVGLPYSETFVDWHACRIDTRGDVWVAGGNLLAARSLDAGALLRFGPPRDDDGAGGWTRRDAMALNIPTHDATTDTATDLDALDDDTDIGPTANHGQRQQGDHLILIGSADTPSFTPLLEGSDVEIVQGPQGGIHGEVVLRVRLPDASAPNDKVVGAMQADLTVGGQLVGFIDVPSYPVTAVADDPETFESSVIPIFFANNDAATYAGQSARLSARFNYLGKSGGQSVDVNLVDQQ